MSKRMPDPDLEAEGFLNRWSRRKREERESEPEETPAQHSQEPVAADENAPAKELSEEEIVAQLPDIDSLDDSSDFTPFLQEKVPEALKRRALRKLFRINPLLANLDGLNDYDEDFTDAAVVIEGMKTAYQVGKGYLTDDESEEEEALSEEENPEEEPDKVAEDESDSTEEKENTAEEALEENQEELSESPDEVLAAESEAPQMREESALRPKGSAQARRWGAITPMDEPPLG